MRQIPQPTKVRYDALLAQGHIPLIVKLLYGCGLRLFECMNLRVNDLNFDTGILIRLRRTKLKKIARFRCLKKLFRKIKIPTSQDESGAIIPDKPCGSSLNQGLRSGINSFLVYRGSLGM